MNGVETLSELEARHIRSALMKFSGNMSFTAQALGISRATLYRKVKIHKIEPEMFRLNYDPSGTPRRKASAWEREQ